MIQRIDPRSAQRSDSDAGIPRANADPERVSEDKSGTEKDDPLESAIVHLCAIGENMRRLMALRAERRRLRVRKLIVTGIWLTLVLIALIPLVITGVIRFVGGMAQGLALLFDGRTWLGDLTTGLVILGGLALAVLAIRSWLPSRGLQKKEGGLGIDAH